MPRLRSLVALVVLALWLPATLHCALEAAGFDPFFPCADEHQVGTHEEATRDSCDVVEGSAFKPSFNTATVPPPEFSAGLPCFSVQLRPLVLTPSVTGVSELVAAPPEVARTWRFLMRAAPPPRAPSSVS